MPSINMARLLSFIVKSHCADPVAVPPKILFVPTSFESIACRLPPTEARLLAPVRRRPKHLI